MTWSHDGPKDPAPREASDARVKSGRGEREVVVLAGGGVAYVSGGVGTLMRYVMDSWRDRRDLPPIRVIDTRGPGGIVHGVVTFARALARLFWLCVAGRVALAHAHMTERGSVARKCVLCGLASAFGVPTIIHMHGADFMAFHAGLPPVLRWFVFRVLRRAHTVIVLGQSWHRFLTETVGLAPERVAIVMNGARGPGVPPPPRDPGRRPVNLLFLGRLGDRKGVPELIAALATPELRGRDWRATLAGDGEVARFRAAVAAAGLRDRVAVPGWVATQGLLENADILVLPSHTEAMPVAVIEALAHGAAVVTTPVGVLPEFLRDGETALLVPPGAPERLAHALGTLIDDPALRQRLARAGRALFEERLDVSVVAERLARIYRDAMLNAPGTRPDPGVPSHRRDCPASAREGVRALLKRIEPVRHGGDLDGLLKRLAAPRGTVIVSFINQHAVNVAWTDPAFAACLRGADVLLRDGVGVGRCMRMAGLDPGLNMNGTDFIPKLAEMYRGRRVALYGTKQPWLDRAAAALRGMGCDLVEVIDGFDKPDSAYAAAAAASRPDLLILAMGIPKQERVGALIAAGGAAPMVIVNGGAIADFLARRVPRAPSWLREAGLEWAYRLCREPARLWGRYIPGGIVFVFRAFLLRQRRGHGIAAPPAECVGDAEKMRF